MTDHGDGAPAPQLEHVLVPIGTRPEIVKLAPVVVALRARGVDVRVVATGQHFDPNMTDVFFDRLGLVPDVRWNLGGDDAERVGAILRHAMHEIGQRRPDAVVVLGDTWSVPLFCLAARAHRVPVAHVEAGLRSFNPTSMEEVNRRVAAATAQLHFAPTAFAAAQLRAEGVRDDRIFVVGNPVLDVLAQLGMGPTPLPARAGAVLTAHRASNVDDPARLAALVRLAGDLVELCGSVSFPVHPRTRRRLHESGLLTALEVGGVELLEPLPYDAMMRLVSHARVVVTDSGGIQEEAAWFGVPTVVLRRSTPRWEGVEAGFATLCGLDPAAVLAAAARCVRDDEQRRIASLPCPYGDGTAGAQVAEILTSPAAAPLLALVEPELAQAPPQRRSA